MRLIGMIRKESLQILRDPSSIAIAFVMPVVLLLLFGYGVSLDARYIPLAVVVEQPDANTASLIGALRHSEYFDPQPFDSIQDAQQAFDLRKVFGIVWLRNDFSERLLGQGDAPIGVIVNGVDANQARITEGLYPGRMAGLAVQLCALAGVLNCRCRSSWNRVSGSTPPCAVATSWCPA